MSPETRSRRYISAVVSGSLRVLRRALLLVQTEEVKELVFTSELPSAVSKLLNLLLREHTQHDNTFESLLEAFLSLLKRFRVDKAAIDLGPASARWDT